MTTAPRGTSASGRRGGRGARERILDAAAELFYLEGINATGVERLASEAAVSKRTLYQHFPSKDAVVEEYLRTVRDRLGEPIRSRTDTPDPRSRLLALFRAPSPGGRMRGCPFHNAAVEAADDMPGIHDIVRDHKRDFVDGLVKLSREAGASNPRALGSQLAVLYEGAAALSTSLDESTPWTHARRAAQTLIDGAAAR